MNSPPTEARKPHKLEEVFRLSGVPTHTFVMPDRYAEIKVSMRTPGRCLVLEGPSGIGKTTTITKVIEELAPNDRPVLLSARKPEDVEYILALPTIAAAGIVIVDDFHRLQEDAKRSLADYMKVLADTEERLTKLVLIGINKAGQQLISFGADAGLRIDIFKLEANSPDKILELIGKGEEALKVSVLSKADIAERSVGSFQIAQMLCHKLCVINGVTEEGLEVVHLRSSVDTIVETVMSELSRQYQNASILFARGPKMKSAGRAPYLHLLKWLSQTDDGALDIRDAMRAHSDMKGSVGQVLDKDFLERHLESLPTKSQISNRCFFSIRTQL